MNIDLNWTDFKSNVDSRKLNIQYFEKGNLYYLYAFDVELKLQCKLDKEDASDFETNYKANSNISTTDESNRILVRPTAAKKGWTYLAHPIELETSKLNSLYSKDSSGTNMNGLTIKFYNSSDVELVAGTQAELDSNCVKTVVHFSPNYDYEIIGGNIHQIASPTSDVRIWVEGGIFELGSSYTKSMTSGINLRFLGVDDHIETDGRASKYMQKDITGVPYQGNQLKFTVKHNTGTNHKIMIVLEYFRA